jgi:hypothetical protein
MTTRTIKGILQAALLGGATCLAPLGALANDDVRSAPQAPDHAQAEARTGAEGVAPVFERIDGAPDHARVEARGVTSDAAPSTRSCLPDHARTESRSPTCD